MNNTPVLQAHALSKTFMEGKIKTPVLHAVDFSVYKGQSVAIMGSSGSGKTTLLQLLAGLDAPSSGKVELLGKPFSSLDANARGAMRNAHMGFVYQFHHLLPEFSSLENVMMPLLIAGVSKKVAKEKAMALIEQVGLVDRYHHRPGMLSGGERQRIAIARAMVMDVDCILADEPTGNLDSHNCERVIDLMLSLSQQHQVALILVTHDQSLASKMQQQYRMVDGVLHVKGENNV